MAHPFTLLKKLGEGTFGEVWLVDRGSGDLAAVKYLRYPTRDHLARFAREAQILWQQLDNRYVVDLIDHDLEASPPYFVMEYCDGGSLRAWVQQRRSCRDVIAVLSQAVLGIAGIHRHGGFHRDLKPENLLLVKLPNGKYRLKVADFGLARVPMVATSMTLSPAGTPGYMAPEVAAGGEYHRGADIYSLGVVGIEILTGDRSVASLTSATVPNRVKDLLRRMVSPHVSARPSLEQVGAELTTLASLGTSQAITPVAPPAAASSKSGGVVKWLIGGAAAAIGLSALFGGEKTTWDSNVGRHRGSDGRFKAR